MDQYLSFHQGELAVQAMANESAIAQRNGRVVSDNILPGAIPFIAQQNMLVISSMDESGRPWSSVLFGRPGFIQANSKASLLLDLNLMHVNEDDPFWHNIERNAQVGVLAIELSTRRRFRVNGRIERLNRNPLATAKFDIKVQQAYPNCPKFIQRRNVNLDENSVLETMPIARYGTELTPEQKQIINKADAFFVSSASEFHQAENDTHHFNVDASHRGGLPGFIKLKGDNQLLIPDYQGNSMFNTLGNIHLYPKAGIIIIDFENAKVLQLSGHAKILWHQEDASNHAAGTNRFWLLTLEKWQETDIPQGIKWYFQDYSPHNPREIKTETDKHIDPNKPLNLKVVKVEQKSPRINLYRLSAAKGTLQAKHTEKALPPFEVGAHLPLEVSLGGDKTVLRHYSILSSVTEKGFYEIAVQREDAGRGGSKAIHNTFELGATVQAYAPKSEFPLIQDDSHKVLIAGGIGITPMLSMLRELAENNASFEIHYSARSEADLAFKEEVKALAGERAFFYASQEPNGTSLDLDELMKKHSELADTQVYLCGPQGLIKRVRELATENAWAEHRIHFESFGASAQTGDRAIEVHLKKSNQVVMVEPKQSILDALSEHKVAVPYDCKRGECGLCATTLIAGEADHRDFYLTQEEQKHQLCLCVSRAKTDSLTLDL